MANEYRITHHELRVVTQPHDDGDITLTHHELRVVTQPHDDGDITLTHHELRVLYNENIIVNAASVIPLEYTGQVDQSNDLLSYEHSGFLEPDAAIPYDHGEFADLDTLIPFENKGWMDSSDQIPYGNVGWAALDNAIPYDNTEAAGAFSVDIPYNHDDGMESATAIPLGYAGNIASSDQVPVNWSGYMDSSGLIPYSNTEGVGHGPAWAIYIVAGITWWSVFYNHDEYTESETDLPLANTEGVSGGTVILYENVGWANLDNPINMEWKGWTELPSIVHYENTEATGALTSEIPYTHGEYTFSDTDIPYAFTGFVDSDSGIPLQIIATPEAQNLLPYSNTAGVGHGTNWELWLAGVQWFLRPENTASLDIQDSVPIAHRGILIEARTIPYSWQPMIEPATTVLPVAYTRYIAPHQSEIPVSWSENYRSYSVTMPVAWGGYLAPDLALPYSNTSGVGHGPAWAIYIIGGITWWSVFYSHDEFAELPVALPVEHGGLPEVISSIPYQNTQGVGDGSFTLFWLLIHAHWRPKAEHGLIVGAEEALPDEWGAGVLAEAAIPYEHILTLLRPMVADIPVEWMLDGWHPFVDLPGWEALAQNLDWTAAESPDAWLLEDQPTNWTADLYALDWEGGIIEEPSAKATDTEWQQFYDGDGWTALYSGNAWNAAPWANDWQLASIRHDWQADAFAGTWQADPLESPGATDTSTEWT